MLQQLKAYALTLVALLGAYTVYWAGISRVLVPPHVEGPPPSTSGNNPGKVGPRRPYQHLFSAGDWELGTEIPVRRIETGRGTLLYQEHKTLSATRLEIIPFTLIVYPQSQEGAPIDADPGRPVVIRAPQGAKISFDSKVDLTRGQLGGPIQGGELNGPVKIYGPESQPGAHDDFVVDTTNVKMDQRSISTPNQVTLHYGPNEFIGSDLVIILAGSALPSDNAPAKKSPLSGIETLTLYTFEKGIIYPEPEKNSSKLGQVDDLPEPIVPVEVVCNGSLRYVSKEQKATLERDVVLTRPNPTGEPDRATCPEGLDIYFGDDDTSTSAALPNVASEVPPRGPGSQVQKVVARGTPENPVVIDAPSRDIHAVGDELEYNVKIQQALMKMLRSGALFYLRQGPNEFWCPDIRYELPPKGKTLGQLWARGPGKIRTVTGEEAEPQALTASWRKQMSIQPQDANDLISLEEGAQINYEGVGNFRADKIHLWVLEIPKTNARKKRPQKTIGEPVASDALLADSGIVPDRMQAKGRVRIESPQLNADTQIFEAWFQRAIGDIPEEQPAIREVATSRQGAVREPGRTPILKGASPRQTAPIQPSVARQMPSIEGTPTKQRSISEPDRRRDPDAPPPQQFHVSADSIRMQLVQQQDQWVADEVVVEGKPVKIRETRVELGVLPLTIKGKVVHMREGASGASKFTIYGGAGPAEIAARGMKLTAAQLHMNQRENRVWSDNPGNMTLMQERDLNNKPLPQPQEILVTWQDGMTFDGLTAKFKRDVTIDGETQHAEAQVLKVTLTRRIDFTDPQMDADAREQGPASELAMISLIDNVFLESRNYDEKGQQVSIEKMEMRTLTIDQITGDVTGLGPGHVSTVRKENGSKFGPIAGNMPAVDRTPVVKNRPDHESVTADNQSLAFLKVNFDDKMRANTQTHEASFGESVEMLYGPVPSWESELTAERRESLGDRGLLLYCESLMVRQMPGQHGVEDSIEFEASGNAHVEGQLFTASARQLSYASNKQQLILKGDGRSDAEIRHIKKGGFMSAQEIHYNTATDQVKLQGANSFDTGFIGEAPPKNSPRKNEPRPPSPRDFRNRR